MLIYLQNVYLKAYHIMNHQHIFYFSSDFALEDMISFDGYAFFDNDLVVGFDGYNSYQIQNKNHEFYADGNYILASNLDHNTILITRDYNGFYPIFYYSTENFWCISNSIKYTVEMLKKKNIPILVNNHNLEIWKSSLALALQLSNHSTFIQGVEVLPVNKDIVIKKQDNNTLSFHLTNRKHPENDDSYKTSLEKCISIWSGRYKTIINSKELALHQDLTGGLDSRVLVSYLFKDIHLVKSKQNLNAIKINSQPEHIKDFEIAKIISKTFDLEINTPINQTFKKPHSVGLENYRVWEYFNIGRYAPIIFPLTNFNPQLLELGGEGGEVNRVFYGRQQDGAPTDFYDYLLMYKKFFSTESLYDTWIDNIKTSINTIRQDTGLENIKNDSILHYKEFRAVHHTSKNPKSRFKFGVLASKYFDMLTKLAPSEKLESSQIMYDIIYNNIDLLLHIPFDEPYKAPTQMNIKALESVNNLSDSMVGKLYVGNNQMQKKSIISIPLSNDDGNNLNSLQHLLLSATNTLHDKEFIDDVLGKDFRLNIEKKFSEIDFNRKSLNLHTNGYFLHTLEILKLIKSFS